MILRGVNSETVDRQLLVRAWESSVEGAIENGIIEHRHAERIEEGASNFPDAH